MRSTLSPAFTGAKMRHMLELVAKVCKQNSMALKQKIDNGEFQKELEFKELAGKYTVDNIATCAFGIEVNSFNEPDNFFQDIANEFQNLANMKTFFKFMGYMICPWLMFKLGVRFISKRAENF